MSKYNFYAIAIGFKPNTNEEVNNIIFDKWEDAKPYVIGKPRARYKGFLSHEEANLWLEKEVEKKNQENSKETQEDDNICNHNISGRILSNSTTKQTLSVLLTVSSLLDFIRESPVIKSNEIYVEELSESLGRINNIVDNILNN